MVAHEVQHILNHDILKGVVIDTTYMVAFTFALAYLINKPSFMLAFGFTGPSYFISLYLTISVWLWTFDFFIRFFITWRFRHAEYNADKFAAEEGLKESMKSALVYTFM